MPTAYGGLVERLPAEPTTRREPPVMVCPECGAPMEFVSPQYASAVPVADTG
jgi:hypothetical protein